MFDSKFQFIFSSIILCLISCPPSLNAQLNISSEIVYKKFSIDSTLSISIPDYLIQTSANDSKTSFIFENIFNDTYCTIEKREGGDESLKNFYERTAKNLESQECAILNTQKLTPLSLPEMRVLARKINESGPYIYNISILKATNSFIIICFWTKESNKEYLRHFEFALNTVGSK